MGYEMKAHIQIKLEDLEKFKNGKAVPVAHVDCCATVLLVLDVENLTCEIQKGEKAGDHGDEVAFYKLQEGKPRSPPLCDTYEGPPTTL